MAIRDDLQIDWDSSPRIVETTSSIDTLTIQDIYDTLRDMASKPAAMDDIEIVDAGGKEGGVVALTMTLRNAQMKFKNTGTPRLCKITGGNLFAVDSDGYDMSPVAYNTNVTVSYAQSTAAAMAQDADIDSIKATVDSLQDDLEVVHGLGLWENRRGIFK
jgi:hypothetical protein